MNKDYQEKVYAGVLGKLIGVYLGRPVEGWGYGQIQSRFGEVRSYVNKELGLPLIVADDDISGTFAFFRSAADFDIAKRPLTARDIGDTWLNYIIEDKTILWWGGLGNSTEHTAYLRLKNGIPAPRSGSIEMNGTVLPQQIGAQIFIDAYAMMCAGDPEKAVYYVSQAASVSHDGIAVDAACFLGAMEAAAFDETRIEPIFDNCEKYIKTPGIQRLVADTRDICAKHNDWRRVRDWLDEHYGYHLYPGPCHMVPNHAMVLASILMGGDSFEESVTIAASAAWDTDCNAGNVGCFNGIRLGTKAIGAGIDYRTEMADRLYVVTSDGGECISDAVKESRKIIAASARLYGNDPKLPQERFAFEFSGSTQGFIACPLVKQKGVGTLNIANSNCGSEVNGLKLVVDGAGSSSELFASVATFLEYGEEYTNYETFASPTLYGGQEVVIKLAGGNSSAAITPYVCVVGAKDELSVLYGSPHQCGKSDTPVSWLVPDTAGMPICRFGLRISGLQSGNESVIIKSIDWNSTPKHFRQKGILMKDMWDLNPYWARAFVSSAKLFAPNLNCTYSISHPDGQGLATIGTADFTDYSVCSTIKPSLHKSCGLVARSRGHRRFYAAILHGGNHFSIIKRRDGIVTTLKTVEFTYEEFVPYTLELSVKGNGLQAGINGEILLKCFDDEPYPNGAAGFIVESGTMYINGFEMISLDGSEFV